ncbi:MAG: hypothetical protein AAF329_14420 [Cyanobacteria bacterium P01_A01_bin.17]
MASNQRSAQWLRPAPLLGTSVPALSMGIDLVTINRFSSSRNRPLPRPRSRQYLGGAMGQLARSEIPEKSLSVSA